MIEKYKCQKCKAVYEITWDDYAEYYNASVEDSDSDFDCDNSEINFCPFCGTHSDAGADEDYDDIFIKD